MKFKRINFFLLYILVPLLIIPFLSYKTASPFGLFGTLLFYSGVLISRFRQWIVLPVPIVFAGWYWMTYGGPSLNDYVFIYLVCLICGVVLNEVSKYVYDFLHKTLPEQMSNLDFNAKVEELNRRLDQYRQENPGKKITHDMVEKIRTEIFFE